MVFASEYIIVRRVRTISTVSGIVRISKTENKTMIDEMSWYQFWNLSGTYLVSDFINATTILGNFLPFRNKLNANIGALITM